jgi:hypothetical protein
MNKTSMIKALLLALPVSLLTAADTSILLIGKAPQIEDRAMVVTGGARAILREGSSETKVTAGEIAFDQSTNALTCVGDSTVSWDGRVLKGRNITIEFGEGTVRVFVARSDGKLLLGNQQAFDSMSTGAQFTPLFSDRLPKTDLDLKSRTRR